MDQVIAAALFVLALIGGLAALVEPVLALIAAIWKYLKIILAGPVNLKTKQTTGSKTTPLAKS